MIRKEIRAPGFVVYEDGGYDRQLAKDSVGTGWAGLIDGVFNQLEKLETSVRIIQVKEKYGGLRIYTDHLNEQFDKFLIEIEKQSYTICEDCGNAGQLREGRWYRTLCDEHAEGRKPIKPF